MKTWFNLLPIFFLPFVLLLAIGFIPSLDFLNLPQHGGPAIRVLFVDTLLLPLLGNTQAWAFATWYQDASGTQQLLLHSLIAINVSVLSFPLLYALGDVYLSIHNRLVIHEFNLKRKEAKQ